MEFRSLWDWLTFEQLKAVIRFFHIMFFLLIIFMILAMHRDIDDCSKKYKEYTVTLFWNDCRPYEK